MSRSKSPDSIVVLESPTRRFPSPRVDGKLPPHHANDTNTKFQNPWSSFRYQSATQWAKLFLGGPFSGGAPPLPSDIKSCIPIQTPTWGKEVGNGTSAKATWLGHASYFVELPTPPGAARGPRIVFDPILSERCSPVSYAGPRRFTDAPCKAENVPPADLILLSHDHFDHTDIPTLRSLLSNPGADTATHIFVALNNAAYLASTFELPPSRVHELEWWDERIVHLRLPSISDPKSNTIPAQVRITCTPSQHTSGRNLFDRWHSLWASWAVEELVSPDVPPSLSGDEQSEGTERTDPFWEKVGKRLYFAGDTGYRTVRDGEDEDEVPVCPAFKEIGERFGGFDVALLPIGAYAPRVMWSNLHASPADAVRMMQDIRAKKALAMHWGTFVLTAEPALEPPLLLREACEKAGLEKDQFKVTGLGETTLF